jgi:eukaryotic-like serine/threonine-protein kinase
MEAPPAKNTLDIRREIKRCPVCGHRFSREAAFCPFDGEKLERARFDPLRDPLIGSTIDGRYEIRELLGEGGMGLVYEVRHVSLDRSFAMKVLRRELARDEELAGRFIDEAKATAVVRHPHVVQITDFGRFPDATPYFVMELLTGRTLGEVIKAGGPIPAARAVRIVEQVAGALGAAHIAGVVHRDLKPENVFLVGGMAGGQASDDVRVVDFGAAKIVGSSRITRQGIVFGTPHYMSPEQASGQPVDHRTDVYSLGVIMYEMFTGRVPFEADTYMGVLTQHMFVQPTPPSRVSPAARELGALEDITLACLAKRPEDRYGSMAELVAALAEVTVAHAEGRSDPPPRGSSRPPASVRYRMADELEPPSLAEMRVAIDSVLPPRRPVPWGWLAAIGGLFGVLLVTWYLAERHRDPAALPVVTVPPMPPPPPPAAASATGVTSDNPPSTGTSSVPAAPTVPAAASFPPPARRAPRPAPPSPRIDDVGDPFAARH